MINRSRGRDRARNGTTRSTASRSGRSTAGRGSATTTAAVSTTAVSATTTALTTLLLVALLLAATRRLLLTTARLSGTAGTLRGAARRRDRSTAGRGGRGTAARLLTTATTTLLTTAALRESFAANHSNTGCHGGNQNQKFTTHVPILHWGLLDKTVSAETHAALNLPPAEEQILITKAKSLLASKTKPLTAAAHLRRLSPIWQAVTTGEVLSFAPKAQGRIATASLLSNRDEKKSDVFPVKSVTYPLLASRFWPSIFSQTQATCA